MPPPCLLRPQGFGIENPKERLDVFGAHWQDGHFPKLPIFQGDFEKRIRSLPIYPKVAWHEWQKTFPNLFRRSMLAETKVICNTIKPLELFDRHSARQSGRQGECRLCKAVYNSIKNQTRITDQHREVAQKRRMYLDLSGGIKIDSEAVYEKYGYKCFKCGKDLKTVKNQNERPLDHTLPAVFLWPLTTVNATLLCRDCNGEKSGKWPSLYYSDQELRRLSVITGISYELLTSKPHFNPDALDRLKDPGVVDELLSKYAPYIDELIKLRNRILRHERLDFFKYSRVISQAWIDRANAALGEATNKEQDTDET